MPVKTPRQRRRPQTPRRTVRVSPELWEKAQDRAEERGETVSDAVRRALERYVR